MVKLSQLGLPNPLSKRKKKINNGSGDNNNNSNEGEKTKEIDRNLPQSHDEIENILVELSRLGVRNPVFKRKKKDINNGSGDNNNNSNVRGDERGEGGDEREKLAMKDVMREEMREVMIGARKVALAAAISGGSGSGRGDNNNNSNEGEKTKEIHRNLPQNYDQINKTLVKLSQLGVRIPVFKRNNINNGSGDNNNNSNEGEKTNDDKGTSGKIVLEIDEKRIHCRGCKIKILKYLSILNGVKSIAVDMEKKSITVEYCNADVKELTEALENFSNRFNEGGDGSGGDKDKKGNDSGGGNDDGDNDGGDKTEDGGGKMGTKMEAKGQRDTRNSHSYYAGDENGYPVGQLQRCYYEKPNVCSIIPVF